MRIRKGHRCLPPPPADRLQVASVQQRKKDVGSIDDAKDGAPDGVPDGAKQALLGLVALASRPVPDNSTAGPQPSLQQEHAKDTSAERKKRLEHELEKNRVSAEDDFNYRSSFCRPGDSEFPLEKMVSSSDKRGAAKHEVQRSRSNSLGSGIAEPSENRSVHGGNQKAAVHNMTTERFVRETRSRDATVGTESMSHKNSSSSSGSKLHNVMQMDAFQCARDDGKGWRCSRPAQAGFSMCKYHRDLVNQGKERRKRARLELTEPTPPFRYVANARVMPDADVSEMFWSPFLDEELSHDENRKFVKAKSIRSILSNSDVQPQQ